jgi:hypothetical protein
VKDPARWLLGGMGFGTLVTGIVATFMHEPEAADVALIISGVGLSAIANLQPVLESFKIDKSGIEAKFKDAEKDIAEGNVVEVNKAIEAVETVLRPATATVTVNPEVKVDAVVTPGNVVMTPDAIASLTRLSTADRADVEAALRSLGTGPGEIGTVIHSGKNAPLDYFVRQVNDHVLIYYRPFTDLFGTPVKKVRRYVVVDIDTAP